MIISTSRPHDRTALKRFTSAVHNLFYEPSQEICGRERDLTNTRIDTMCIYVLVVVSRKSGNCSREKGRACYRRSDSPKWGRDRGSKRSLCAPIFATIFATICERSREDIRVKLLRLSANIVA